MPEQLVDSKFPWKDAINKVTSNGRDAWKFISWTTPISSNKAVTYFGSFAPENATSGMRGQVTRPNGETRNFTIRHDWDYASGSPSAGKGGKGYHVNVELPKEKYAFFNKTTGANEKSLFDACVRNLSERRRDLGDEDASKWFMETTRDLSFGIPLNE